MNKSHIHPLDTGFSRIVEMGRNLTEEAKKLGLSATKPVRLNVLGVNQPQGWYTYENRQAIVSFSQPENSAYDTELWVNPLNKRIFKSLPTERVWNLVRTYSELFAESANAFVSSVAPKDDSIGQPVANIPELLAIDTNPTPDKSMYYVESERAIYAFDKEGTDPVSSPTVLQPNVGPGRWYLITTTAEAIGTIDAGIYS